MSNDIINLKNLEPFELRRDFSFFTNFTQMLQVQRTQKKEFPQKLFIAVGPSVR